ncbi:MAG: hypothetical protein GXP63_02835 [DPANN group archaeon]|nr:hypothetical protein [DPANN group archaeon]
MEPQPDEPTRRMLRADKRRLRQSVLTRRRTGPATQPASYGVSGQQPGQQPEERHPRRLTRRPRRRTPIDDTLTFVALPIGNGTTFLHLEGLERILEEGVPSGQVSAAIYLIERPERPEPFYARLAGKVEAMLEHYPVDTTFDPRLPKKKKAWYLTTLILPFVPSSVPIIGKPFSYVRRLTTTTGALLGLMSSLPTPDDLLGGVLFGAMVGWMLPTLYGMTALGFDLVSRRYHHLRLKEHLEDNRNAQKKIKDLSDRLRYQEMPVSIMPIEDMRAEGIGRYDPGREYRQLQRTPYAPVERALAELVSSEEIFNAAPYPLRRYYRAKLGNRRT